MFEKDEVIALAVVTIVIGGLIAFSEYDRRHVELKKLELQSMMPVKESADASAQ